ncbi:putative Yip1 domain member 6 protein [Monocercomonoides exilis]|uniref:putative Yip1 domain member 6 protein n=1 Tax=Monocercomonoides exilis TaxID=2049356 RepID=UPI00355A7BD1|nr:putative Yip1 domain member 6 protein [Monocercomonoides exilis]
MTSFMDPLPSDEGGEMSDDVLTLEDSDTLNESVMESILRDGRSIVQKLAVVLIPSRRKDLQKELRNWDLWGPLLICLTLACCLVGTKSSKKDPSVLFSIVFVVMWLGSTAVTVNITLLGGQISFFQSVCLLGYVAFPFAAIALIGLILSYTAGLLATTIVKGVLGIAALVWALIALIPMFRSVVDANRVVLALYPVCLFCVSITWLSITS